MRKTFVSHAAVIVLLSSSLIASNAIASNKGAGGKVEIVRHVGEKITKRSAQQHEIAGLPTSDLVHWKAESKLRKVWTVRIQFITGDEESTSDALTFIGGDGELPNFKSFLRIVEGSHGGIDDTYTCHLSFTNGTVAIQDWKPSNGGVISGIIRGTLKLTASTGKVPPLYARPQKLDIMFWAKAARK